MSATRQLLRHAAMESWFSDVQVRARRTFESIHRGKNLAFDYIECSTISVDDTHLSATWRRRSSARYHDSQRSKREGIVSRNSTGHTMYNNTHGRDRSGHDNNTHAGGRPTTDPKETLVASGSPSGNSSSPSTRT